MESRKNSTPRKLSHIDDKGQARMVDVNEKETTVRRAVANGRISMAPQTLALLEPENNPKGDATSTARVAGIMAGKRTWELIPMCHNIPLGNVSVEIDKSPEEPALIVTAEASTVAATGVEMEALTACCVALLTLYDMLKSADKDMTIGEIHLVSKEGGKSDQSRGISVEDV